MKQNWVNEVELKGYVFKHTLAKRVTGPQSKNPGTEFINGELQVATDAEGINVVPIRFSYVTPTTKAGKENRTYTVLSQIIDGGKTYETDGTDAPIVRVQSRIGVNDWLNRDGEMVATKMIDGGFVSFIREIGENPANFKCDMLIINVQENEVEDGDDYAQLMGYTFNFRGDLIPLTLSTVNPQGIKYFVDQDITPAEPMLTTVWGKIVSTTVVNTTETETAWGEVAVQSTSRTLRAWNVTGSAPEPMEFDDESTITVAEFEKGKQDRVALVAAEKARVEEYRKSQQGNAFDTATTAEEKTVKAASPTAPSDFVF